MTTPPSQTAEPDTLCPPPRTATGRPESRAKFTAAITSALPEHRTITAGQRSIMPFQTLRAVSYSVSRSEITRPRILVLRSSIAAASSVVMVGTPSIHDRETVVGERRHRGQTPRRNAGRAPLRADGSPITIEHLPGETAALVPARAFRPGEHGLAASVGRNDRMFPISG